MMKKVILHWGSAFTIVKFSLTSVPYLSSNFDPTDYVYNCGLLLAVFKYKEHFSIFELSNFYLSDL
jgi:hypothetical protein